MKIGIVLALISMSLTTFARDFVRVCYFQNEKIVVNLLSNQGIFDGPCSIYGPCKYKADIREHTSSTRKQVGIFEGAGIPLSNIYGEIRDKDGENYFWRLNIENAVDSGDAFAPITKGWLTLRYTGYDFERIKGQCFYNPFH